MLWRFRYSLISEARALTKFLKCVDWGDAQEARQAADLMQAWAPIAIADALELLSPDFPNEQVSCSSPHPCHFALVKAVCLMTESKEEIELTPQTAFCIHVCLIRASDTVLCRLCNPQ